MDIIPEINTSKIFSNKPFIPTQEALIWYFNNALGLQSLFPSAEQSTYIRHYQRKKEVKLRSLQQPQLCTQDKEELFLKAKSRSRSFSKELQTLNFRQILWNVNSVHFAARYVVLSLSYYSLKEVEGGKMGEKYTAANQSKFCVRIQSQKNWGGQKWGRRFREKNGRNLVYSIESTVSKVLVASIVIVVAVYVNKSLVSAHFVLWFIIIQTSFFGVVIVTVV